MINTEKWIQLKRDPHLKLKIAVHLVVIMLAKMSRRSLSVLCLSRGPAIQIGRQTFQPGEKVLSSRAVVARQSLLE